MPVDQSTVAQIAAQANVPPSILFGLTQLSGYGDKVDNSTQLQQVAQQLTDAFAKDGSWEAALSEVISGDPNAAQSPTSPVGGQVAQVMGIAAARPSWGITGVWQPASQAAFKQRALAFGKSIQTLSQLGGVVTPDHTKQWYQTAATVRRGAQQLTGPSPDGGQVGSGPSAWDSFFVAVLQRLGMPVSSRNLSVLGTMARGEGMATSSFNPLATTQPAAGAGQFNSVGVRDYTSFDQGVEATAQTLMNGNYPGLLAGLQQSAPPSYYTSGEAAANLRTWQGGSSEDVNLLGGTADPGSGAPRTATEAGGAAAAPQAGQQADAHATPSPQAVASFAQQAKSMGLTPEHFMQLYPHLAATRRRLLGLNTDLSDVAPHVGQTPDQVVASVRATPHPVYPELTAGQVMDSINTASLWSFQYTQKPPTLAEAARMASAGMKHQDIASYYKAQAPVAPSLPGTGGGQPSLSVMQGGNNRPDNTQDGEEPKRKQGGPQ